MDIVLLRRHQWRWLVIALALSAGAVVLVAGWGAGGLLVFLAKASPFYLGTALLVVSGLWVVEALRVKAIAELTGARQKLSEILQANLAAAFVSAITPASAGGPPAQAYFLARLGLEPAKAAAVVAARLLLNLAFFSVASTILFYLYCGKLGLARPLGVAVAAGAAGLSVAVAVLGYLLSRPSLAEAAGLRLAECLERLGPQWGAWAKGVLVPRLAAFRGTLILIAGARWRARLLLAGLTGLFWLGFFSLAYLLMLSLGLKPTYVAVMVRQLLYYFVISYVPLPGASGVAELGLAALFAGVIPQALLPGFVAAWRFLTYHLNIVVGGPFFWALTRSPVHRPVEEL